MTTLTGARESIYQRASDNWGSTSPFCFANETFVPTAGTAWVRFIVEQAESEQRTLGGAGNRRFERDGVIRAQINVPLDSGLREADELGAVVIAIFEGVTFQGVWTGAARTREAGKVEVEGLNWFRYDVEVDYSFHETR